MVGTQDVTVLHRSGSTPDDAAATPEGLWRCRMSAVVPGKGPEQGLLQDPGLSLLGAGKKVPNEACPRKSSMA